MFNKIGSKWSQISKMEPLLGRTVSQIKNRYYQNLKGKDISKIKYKAADQLQDSSDKDDVTKNLRKRKLSGGNYLDKEKHF